MSKTVVVLAQRRTGSSMIAGILHYLGVSMGAGPEQSGRFNKKGFFEDRDIIEISEEIISYINSPDIKRDIAEVVSDKDVTERKREAVIGRFEERIKTVMEEKDKGLWGFKDVNQVELHPLYQRFIKNPHYIFVFRNPISATRSFINWHEHADFYQVLGRVLERNMRLAKMSANYSQDHPVLVLAYENCLGKPKETIDSIVKFLDISPTEENIEDAIAHIDPSIKHF